MKLVSENQFSGKTYFYTIACCSASPSSGTSTTSSRRSLSSTTPTTRSASAASATQSHPCASTPCRDDHQTGVLFLHHPVDIHTISDLLTISLPIRRRVQLLIETICHDSSIPPSRIRQTPSPSIHPLILHNPPPCGQLHLSRDVLLMVLETNMLIFLYKRGDISLRNVGHILFISGRSYR